MFKEKKMSKRPVYVRCPRCELNYIQKKDKFCSVCKAEMEAKRDYADDIDDLELCPICKTNYIQPDEIMCVNCLKEHRNEDGELSSDWDDYINREDDEDVMTMDEEMGEMTSVSDITQSSMLDEDDIGAGLEFDDSDTIDFGEEFDDDDADDDDDDDEDYDDDDDDDIDISDDIDDDEDYDDEDDV